MDTSWQIRKAIVEDSDALKRCMESAYSTYQGRMGGILLPPMNVDYAAEIEHYPAWVVESAGDILAGLFMIFENDEASIANIAVDPGYQGHGIGGALMRFAESQARERDFSELQLATHVLLNENLSLYCHPGWLETGRDESRVFMKKRLISR